MREITYIYGFVHFRSRRDLAQTAQIVADVLGIHLVPDAEGIYEEFPAYIGHALGLEVAVLGPPDDSALQEECQFSEVGVIQLRPAPGFGSYETRFKGDIDISANLEELLQTATDFEILPNRGPVFRHA